MMQRYHFVVNPMAGRGRASAVWTQVHAALTERIVAHDQHAEITFSSITDKEYDYASLPKGTILVSVGGDGTVHHIGQLALNHGHVLGLVPAGTGNDYATSLGFSDRIDEAIETLLFGVDTPLDVIQFGTADVLNAGGIGLDASVVHFIEARPILKRLRSLGYAVALPVVLGKFRSFSIQLTIDGECHTFENVSMLVLANGPSFGGGMRIVPSANLRDGLIDICVVSNIKKSTLLRLFPRIYSGEHVHHPAVTLMRGRNVQLSFKEELLASEYDGEPYHIERDQNVSIRPHALTVRLPQWSTYTEANKP